MVFPFVHTYNAIRLNSVHSSILSLDGLDLEMQRYQGEHQRLKILDKVVKNTQTFRVLRFCDIDERANFGGLLKSFST
jgi:hypothetical protein